MWKLTQWTPTALQKCEDRQFASSHKLYTKATDADLYNMQQ